MAYVALYRKYRSQSFDELMGQEAVTTTLRNALRQGRIAHAYLFHGARGCGKTSTARLMARALNCVAQDGPTAEPCGTCVLCTAIRQGSCMDVVEIDAASETSIDDVREKIIENVQYAPVEGRYKVYIIDEVHDLSAKAFDALLKTLEEPPAHVVFILATTEWHKVPITIRSRCQPFPFRRGTIQDLAASIQRVIDAEGYTAEPDAVQSLARSAEGSWRDALSLLEQVLAYTDGHITSDAVNRAVGTVGGEMLGRVLDAVASGSWDAVLESAAELIDSGADARQTLTALHGHLRDLLLVTSGGKSAAAELGSERAAALSPQAALFTPSRLLSMMAVLAAAEREVRYTNHHRWLLESALLRLTEQPSEAGRAAPVRSTPESPPAEISRQPVPVPAPRASAPPPPRAAVPEPPDDSYADATAAEPSPADAPAPGRFAEAVTFEVIERSWDRILNLCRQTSQPAFSYLQKARPTALQDHTVILAFQDVFSRDRIQNKGRELVERKLNQALESTGYRVQCVLLEQAVPETAEVPAVVSSSLLDSGPADDVSAAAPVVEPAAPEQASLLQDALGVFGGEVVSVEEGG